MWQNEVQDEKLLVNLSMFINDDKFWTSQCQENKSVKPELCYNRGHLKEYLKLTSKAETNIAYYIFTNYVRF